MAVYQNNPFDVDPSQYLTWKKIVTPDGQTYYEVPGNPGYVYDPVRSKASGRTVYRPSPKLAIEEQQKQADALEKQQKQADYANSPQGQLVPIVGGTVGTLGAYEIMKPGAPSTTPPATPPPAAAPPATTPPAATTPGQAAAEGATGTAPGAAAGSSATVTEVGSAPMPDGSAGTKLSDGTVVGENGAAVTEDGTTIDLGPYINAGMSAVAAYQAYKAYKEGDNVGAGIYAASAGASGAAAAGSTTGAAAAGPLAAAAVVYTSYKNYKAAKKNSEGGAFTSDETESIANPFAGAFEKYLGKEVGGGINEIVKVVYPYQPIADSLWGSSKSDEQILTDRLRKRMQDRGVLSEDWMITNADGSQFDFGKDGGARITNPDGSERRYHEIDANNPLAAEIIPYADLLADIAGAGGDEAMRSRFAGYFVNAALQGATTPEQAVANIKKYFDDMGISQEVALGTIAGLQEAKKIDEERAAVYGAKASGLGLKSQEQIEAEAAQKQQAQQADPAAPPQDPAAPPPPQAPAEAAAQGATNTNMEQAGDTLGVDKKPANIQQPPPQQTYAELKPGEGTGAVDTARQNIPGGMQLPTGLDQPQNASSAAAEGFVQPNRQINPGNGWISPHMEIVPPEKQVNLNDTLDMPILNPSAQPAILTPPRSGTSSPGIGADGRRLTAQEMAKMLAARYNARA